MESGRKKEELCRKVDEGREAWKRNRLACSSIETMVRECWC